jgi:Methyltransferase small domain
MSQKTHAAPWFSDPDDFKRLREVFYNAGYSDTGVLETLGVTDFPGIKDREPALLMRRTAGGRPLDILIRLFLMEVPVSTQEAVRAFSPMALGACVEAGLIRPMGDQVAAIVKLLPFRGMFIAFDQMRMLLSEEGARFVMGIGASSLTLSTITIRAPSRWTLDLGTGCGIQALMAAGHSERVLATDKNPRATRLCVFNARLNGFDHLHSLVGDLFDPLGPETFDLVVTNPPFVISPESRYIYRDGGMRGDGICRRIVREVPRYLSEGGFCQMLCNWTESADESWQDRLRRWADGTGCDMWVIRSESRNAADYAVTWIRHTEPGLSPEAFAARFDAWMDYYRALNIESVSAGLIMLRRRKEKSPWFRADEAPDKMIGPSGEDIQQGFAFQDYLESLGSDTALFEQKLRRSDHLNLLRRARPEDGGWAEESIQLTLTRGLAYTADIDHYVANLVIGCNGDRPLRELLAEMADAMGGVDPAAIAGALAQVVRGLLTRGFLMPAAKGVAPPSHFDQS